MATTPAPSSHLLAYTVKEIAGKRSIYTKIGAAFPHKEDAGFNVQLDALPLDGKIVILPPKRDTDEPVKESASA